MTAVITPPAEEPVRERESPPRRPVSRWVLVVGVVVGWLVLWLVFRGRDTLDLAQSALTPLHRWFNDLNDTIGASRNSNPVFLYFFNEIRLAVDNLVTGIQYLISQPVPGRGAPLIGWLGVVAIAGYVSWAFGNIRVAVLAAVGFVFFGLQGLWEESMDTLALTAAAVLIALVIGIPVGILAGRSPRVNRIITPVLDFMQTMPTFVYLAPLTLFFLIGPASATIATLIYAMPPAIRITAHAIAAVPPASVEAADSLGATGWQTLRKVLLPMAKRTIVLGINQTIMAALAMVTIAALIDAPGLGQVVIKALQSLDVGTAFNAGLAIVVMAVVLDRVTTAAGARAEEQLRHPGGSRLRRPLLVGGGVVTLVCGYLSYTYVWAAEFPDDANIGPRITGAAEDVTLWVQDNFSVLTNGLRDAFTTGVLNPFEALLTESPWWLMCAVVVALALVLGGARAAVVAAVCLGLLVGTGLWRDAMTTLTSTLIATVVVIVIGVLMGVWMGRSRRADRVIRPLLDAGQTMPAFVYLVPFVALFGASRFSAIVADGIRGVSATTVEAATAAGAGSWQTITKVQLPMASRSLTLATNQGLIYVLSMVVVGGLVGAGALGYDVVAGFSQGQLYGKGLAAGLAIVLLGIMLDRITQAAARRTASPTRGGGRSR
ncbi:MAG: ABC transporter permease subunit [Actinophytocola sp.]|uniref:ABC transporter permease n=1 Tax=Actinophytocola sp. TaxID=1872138 RepID=UPI0013259910|nr:ABC transporter permease subunit [Actinophytocola sp.]MPZ84222.1 ABC transporter permease subunit [Actinophytocola sp.]